MAIETVQEEVATEVGHRQVARNTFVYFAAQVATWSVSFATVSIIPRRLGEATIGEITRAGAAVAPVAMGLMLGVESYLTYEVGRDRRQAESLLRALLGLRLCTIPLMAVAVLAVLFAVHPTRTVIAVGMVLLASSAVAYVSDPLGAVLAGWEEAHRVSAVNVAVTAGPLLCIPFLVLAPEPLVRSHGAIAYVAAGLVVLPAAVAARVAWVRRRIKLRPTFDTRTWGRLVRGGLPFLANSLVLQLYGFVSVFILWHFTSDRVVGEFAQAQKLFGTFLFIPTALSAALLPALARLAESDPDEFKELQVRVLSLLIVVGLPVVVLTLLLAHPLCRLLYGPTKFAGVPIVLQAYALNLIPVYVVSVMYQFLVAQRKNLIWTVFLTATVGLVAVLTVLFVPLARDRMHNGAVGAVLATVTAEVCCTVCACVLLKTNPLTRDTLWRIARALAACAVMAAAVWATRGLFVVVPAALGVAVFCGLGWALKLLGADEQARLVAAVRRRLGRQTG